MSTIRIEAGMSIQKAIDEASSGDLTAIIATGRYEEKVFINRSNVTLLGDGDVEIVFSDHHGTVRNGKIFGTGDSATFTVGAPNFKAVGIRFTNSFDYPYWHEYKINHPNETIDTQAVAFRTVIGATRTILKECTFSSYQDTVYADAGVHLFSNCTIIGNVDFIFGAGQALFEKCRIESNGEGFVAAPSTFSSDDIGFVFNCCTLSGKVKDSVYLARPWHPSGSMNRNPMAIFVNCSLGEHIKKELWTGMNSRTPEGVKRYWLPEESRFSISDDSRYKDRLMALLQQS